LTKAEARSLSEAAIWQNAIGLESPDLHAQEPAQHLKRAGALDANRRRPWEVMGGLLSHRHRASRILCCAPTN
jgi:hypothetical protein